MNGITADVLQMMLKFNINNDRVTEITCADEKVVIKRIFVEVLHFE